LAYSTRNKQIAILIAVSVIVAMLGVIALNMTVLPNVANVQAIGIEIYWDSDYAKKVSLIEWGTLEPGATKNATVYILNTGNSNIMLSKNATNWSPSSASDYIALSWDYKGQRISPEQGLKATLTLVISPNIQGITQFSFDLFVAASG